jgi:hypothetical protein
MLNTYRAMAVAQRVAIPFANQIAKPMTVIRSHLTQRN